MNFQESTQHDTLILPCGSTEPASCGLLDVAVEDYGITIISLPTLKNIWNKAEHLVQANGGDPEPWSSDIKARLVMSSSSKHPHRVKMQRKTCH